MSKRGPGANFGFGEDRYGGAQETAMEDDKPKQATAAQMARRKIAQGKSKLGGANRARSGSPAVPQMNPGNNIFGNGNPQQQQQPQAQPQNASFSSNFNFTFGQPAQQEASGSPAPFQFGASAPAQPNGSSMFGQNNTPSFGSTFGGGSTQPQQNGFNPTTSIFNQPTQSTNQTPSFTFGQTQSTQSNGSTPATTTSNVFGGFGKAPDTAQNGTTSFGGFGATQQDREKSSTPFSGFGATQPEKEKSSTPFGGFGMNQPEKEKTPFGGFGATQADKEKSSTPFTLGGTQQEQETPKPANPFASFGAPKQAEKQSEKASTPAFAGFGAPKNIEAAEAPSDLFKGFGQKPQESTAAQSNPFASFSQKQPETTEKSSFPQTNGEKAASPVKDAPKNPFAGFGASQLNGEKSSNESQPPKANIFNFGSSQTKTPQPETQAEKSSSNNIFGGFSQSTQTNGEKKGLFGASLAPGPAASSSESIFSNLPKKDLTNGGKPIFDSSDPSQIYREEDDEDEDPSGGSSSNNIFDQAQQPATKPTSNVFNFGNQPQAPETSLFQKPDKDTPSVNTSTPSGTPAPPRSLFDRIDKNQASSRQAPSFDRNAETPKTSFGGAPETPATVKPLFPGTSSSTLAQPLSQAQEIGSQTPKAAPPRSLFDRIEKPASHPSAMPPTAPLREAAAPPPSRAQTGQPSPMVELTAVQSAQMKQLNAGILQHLSSENQQKDWTSIFDYYADTAARIRDAAVPQPKAAAASGHQASRSAGPPAEKTTAQPASSNIFSQSSKPTAPISTFGAQTPRQPAAGDLFSKPPSTAPQAARKRSLEDDASAGPAATEKKRQKPNETVSYPKLPENASSTAKLFEAALDKSKPAKASTTTSGFNPSTKPMFPTANAGDSAAPSTGGFKPTFGTGTSASGSFLSSFGSKAQEQEKKDQEKRRDEDYDSDEETVEQWEKRDREEQEAKRKKIEEATKSAKGFTFTATSTNGDSASKTPFKFGSTSTSSTTPSQPPPAKLNGLFGTAASQAPSTGKLAPPSTGFNFGPKPTSKNASRATSPGVTTDGEASNAADGEEKENEEPSDDQNMQQADDVTALQASEREANDVLLELSKATTKKYIPKSEDTGKAAWRVISEGRVYVLKEKDTGKTRILNKIGFGKLGLNFHALKGMKYELHPKKETMVVGTFMDNLHSVPAKLDRFFITAETAQEAKELARLLTEGAS